MSKKKTEKTLDSSEILNEIVDTMSQWGGVDIAAKAEEILGHPVTYLGDDLFLIKDNE
jgi:hypothetical protein